MSQNIQPFEAWKNLSLDDMSGEIWREIYGYETYHISNYGRIKSLPKLVYNPYKKDYIYTALRIRKLQENNDGYLVTGLNRDGKRKSFSAHRLVAIHFIPNPNNHKEVNHKKGDKKNNMDTMLEWCSPHENQLHSVRVLKNENYKKANEVVRLPVVLLDKDFNFKNKFESVTDAIRAIGGNINSISSIQRSISLNQMAMGYRWFYLDDYECRIKNKIAFYKNKTVLNFAKRKLAKLDFSGMLIHVYDSVYSAAESLSHIASKYKTSALVKCAKGIQNSVYGFKWMYYDDYLKTKEQNEE